MKIGSALAILIISGVVAAAQDRMADNLRKGVVEEESKHNLTAAIQDYQAALAQFDEIRQTAATALFRMAECYRKQGKDDLAMAAYKRVAQEFTDQGKLAEQSRSILSSTYHAAAVEASSSKKQEKARETYRETLVEEMELAGNLLNEVQGKVKAGILPQSALLDFRIRFLEAQRQLAAFDAGIPLSVAPSTGK